MDIFNIWHVIYYLNYLSHEQTGKLFLLTPLRLSLLSTTTHFFAADIGFFHTAVECSSKV